MAQADLGLQAVRQVRQAAQPRSSRRSATVVDEIAFVHNMVGKTGVHSQGTLLQTTGFNRPGFPGMGCWVSYGLGSMNDEPADVRRAARPSRAGLERHQELGLGVPARAAPGHRHLPRHEDADRRPVPATSARSSSPAAATRPGIDLLGQLNREHAAARPGDERLEARIKSYELAAKMQLAAPEALDLSKEPKETLKLYGLDHGKTSFDKEINPLEETDYFGRKCLVARRLLERGVRFVQVWSGNDNGFPRRNWDRHEDVKRDHGPLAYGMARGRRGAHRGPEAAPACSTTPSSSGRPSSAGCRQSQGGKGRDHNPYCFTNWLAGGGIKGGVTHGPSDEFGYKPADRKNPTEVYDIHATILHLLGIDHTEADRPPQRHRPPPDRRAWARHQGVAGVRSDPQITRMTQISKTEGSEQKLVSETSFL